ncbi:MAG: transcription antitermination factor NusB [Clostridia bacterium]|nr:transcription antitermination factor NusB [Clostridia bacterium]
MNRKTARENAFILLFELASKTDETAEEIFEKATEIRSLECDDFVKRVFFGVNENLRVIDECIEKSIVGWKSSRLSLVSRASLRLAVYEMMFMEDVPVKVSINEAIELSKKYDDEKAYMLVNGALNSAKELLGKQ